ncbi:MAG: HAMP domain-containing sensor histidine kinase [Pseudomonadota bacterium]
MSSVDTGLDGWAPRAHDIRNIVASISLIADELSGEDTTRQKQLGLRLQRSCDRMMDICAGPSLDAPDMGQDQARTEMLDHLVSDVLELAQFVAGDAVHLSASVPPVKLDIEQAQAIFRILSNLVTNAVMAQRTLGGAVRVQARSLPDRLEIDVVDRGPGLLAKPARRAATISAVRRSGLGTTICELLAKGIGAEVALVRTGSRGTRFRITLPTG